MFRMFVILFSYYSSFLNIVNFVGMLNLSHMENRPMILIGG